MPCQKIIEALDANYEKTVDNARKTLAYQSKKLKIVGALMLLAIPLVIALHVNGLFPSLDASLSIACCLTLLIGALICGSLFPSLLATDFMNLYQPLQESQKAINLRDLQAHLPSLRLITPVKRPLFMVDYTQAMHRYTEHIKAEALAQQQAAVNDLQP